MYDGDLIFTTNNDVLIRKHRKLPAILCVQRNTEKVIPTEEDVLKTNINAMGNKVGSITNRATSMMDKQSYFEKGTHEYNDIQTRIEICQLEQQNEIDKIKGIVAKPMPDYWYMMEACEEDDYLCSICTNRKPYFMMYIYEDYKWQYNSYFRKENDCCVVQFQKRLSEVLEENVEHEYIERFYKYAPLSDGNCTMNRICHYVERVMDDYKVELSQINDFDNSYMYYEKKSSLKIKKQLFELAKQYCLEVKEFRKTSSKTREQYKVKGRWLTKKYRELGEQICPNEKERLNIVLQLGFDNKFLWDCCGNLIIKRLEELS